MAKDIAPRDGNRVHLCASLHAIDGADAGVYGVDLVVKHRACEDEAQAGEHHSTSRKASLRARKASAAAAAGIFAVDGSPNNQAQS